jgi:very-short-patch-repair endonuclease
MPEHDEISDALSTCESGFEHDLMQRLLDRRYRVQGQVGSIGYRIDMVVEGLDGTRLAIECDGDRFHGPEQWQQDMRRQRTLERVGWRFWRCFASSFYRDADGVMNDLFEMLTRMGIEPSPDDSTGKLVRRFAEYRTINLEPSAANAPEPAPLFDDETGQNITHAETASLARSNIEVGDKVVLIFSDDQKRVSARLIDGANDLEKGRLSIASPLGRAVMGAEEGDEVELPLENGRQRKVLIEGLGKSASRTSTPDSASVNSKVTL